MVAVANGLVVVVAPWQQILVLIKLTETTVSTVMGTTNLEGSIGEHLRAAGLGFLG